MHSITQTSPNVHSFVSPLDVDSRRRAVVQAAVLARLAELPDDEITAYLKELVKADQMVAEANDTELARLIYHAAKPSAFDNALACMLDADDGTLEAEGVSTRVLPQDAA